MPEVRDDLRDYIAEIRRFDADVGGILACIENSGRYGNTVVVITSDNGPPFPRAKANLYDVGTRVPLAILIPDTPGPGQTIDVLVSHLDIAPTLLDLAGLQTPPEVAGRSLLELVSKGRDRSRRQVFLERERHHGRARVDGSGYPSRGIRTDDYLYIRNYAPDRWPAGDPSKATVPLGDVDDSPTKTFIVDHRDDPAFGKFFHLACAKRAREELFDISTDPWQFTNLATKPEYSTTRTRLHAQLMKWMRETGDHRAFGPAPQFDRYPYYGR